MPQIGLCMFLCKGAEKPYQHRKYFYRDEKDTQREFPSVEEDATLQLSIIVPAYNEEKRIHKMLDETLGYCKTRAAADDNFTYEVIVVDDGSRDSTSSIVYRDYVLTEKTDTFRLLTLEKNVGKGGAVRRVNP